MAPCLDLRANAIIVFFHQKTGDGAAGGRWWTVLQRSGYSQILSGHQLAGLHASTCQQLLLRWPILGFGSPRTPWLVLAAQVPPPTHLKMPRCSCIQWKKQCQAEKNADCKFIFHVWNKWKKSMDYNGPLNWRHTCFLQKSTWYWITAAMAENLVIKQHFSHFYRWGCLGATPHIVGTGEKPSLPASCVAS